MPGDCLVRKVEPVVHLRRRSEERAHQIDAAQGAIHDRRIQGHAGHKRGHKLRRTVLADEGPPFFPRDAGRHGLARSKTSAFIGSSWVGTFVSVVGDG